MNAPESAPSLPPEMLRKLNEVRDRHRRVQIQSGLLLGAAMLLAGMLVAMAVDWVVVLRDPRLRWIFTLSALACGLAGLFRWGLLPLLRPPSLEALAREVDRLHPFLQERYLTLTEFARNTDAPEIRGSPAMIGQVADQAASLSAKVQPMSVISRARLVFAAKCFAALAGVFVLLFALDFQRATVLCERFLRPGADISLTRLEARSGDLRIGKGESVTLEVLASGKAASSATLYLRSEKGRSDEIVMRRNAGAEAGFVYTENSVMDSFEYQARAGDGQTAWHHVTVVDRPKIAQVKLRVTAPAYSKLPLVEETTLPHLIRALEGSRMDLTIQPDQPLKSLVLLLADGKSIPLVASPDGGYQFTTILSNSFTFQPVLTNPREMENLDKPDCEVVVYPDEPPMVRVLSPNNQVTAGSDEKVQVNFEARDDFGIAQAELDVSITGGSNTIEKVIPIPLEGAEAGAKLVRKQVELDLAQFNLKQGQELTYVVRVTDTKSSPALSSESSPSNRNNNQLAQNGQSNSPANSPTGLRGEMNQGTNGLGEMASVTPPNPDQNQNGGRNQPANSRGNQNPGRNNVRNSGANPNQNQNQDGQPPNQNPAGNENPNGNPQQNQNENQNENQNQNLSQNSGQNSEAQNQSPDQNGNPNNSQNQNGGQNQNQNGGQNQNQPGNQAQNQNPNGNQGTNQNQNSNQNQSPQSAQNNPSANSQQQQQQPSGGSQPPPDNMSRRTLPGGQSASAQPQTVKVDNWSGSFQGEQRQKQELAIDAIIKQLDELLAKAEDGTEATLANRHAAAKLEEALKEPLNSAQEYLRQVDTNVDDLRAKSDGTPYAFIGLQMRDIRDSHVSPARDELGAVTGEAAAQTNDVASLEQAAFHIIAARKALADLTKSYEDAKRDNKLEDATQQIAKMHQLFIEDTQALLGSKRSAINTQNRKMAEVGDDFVDKLQKLLEEQKKIMDELAKTLAEDPRMLRRFLAMQELDSVTLRDQLTLQARREQQLAGETAAWTNTAEANRGAFLKQELGLQSTEQLDITDLAMKLRENMFTWWPLDASTNREDFAGDLALASDLARLAGNAVSPKKPAESLTNAHLALDKLRELYARLPELETNDASYTNFGSYIANRMQDTGELITRQSGWIKKMESLQAGDLAQAVEVDQHSLTVDTTTLQQKLDGLSVALSRVSPGVADKVSELMVTMNLGVLGAESAAEDSLGQPDVAEAADHQAEATNAFARAEGEFDDILHLIAAKQDQAPPPTNPGQAPSLDDMLTMLKNEQKLREQLGLSARPMNVSIMRDWMSPSSSPSSGQSQASAQAARQQAYASQQQANSARQQALNQQMRNQRNRGNYARNSSRNNPGRGRANPDPNGDPGVPGDPAGAGPSVPTESWNTLVSKLGDEIRQGRDNVPPEQYRQAIEHYFEQISETLPIAPAPAPAPADPPHN